MSKDLVSDMDLLDAPRSDQHLWRGGVGGAVESLNKDERLTDEAVQYPPCRELVQWWTTVCANFPVATHAPAEFVAALCCSSLQGSVQQDTGTECTLDENDGAKTMVDDIFHAHVACQREALPAGVSFFTRRSPYPRTRLLHSTCERHWTLLDFAIGAQEPHLPMVQAVPVDVRMQTLQVMLDSARNKTMTKSWPHFCACCQFTDMPCIIFGISPDSFSQHLGVGFTSPSQTPTTQTCITSCTQHEKLTHYLPSTSLASLCERWGLCGANDHD